ncbi:MAG: 16S rRNA (uracil(1498)-N(3))-methyltransferase [Pseudomonadota bacterium]
MASPRFYIDKPLTADTLIGLPPGPARHAQVLRMQPGYALTLFNGQGGEWQAEVVHMGRNEVQVKVLQHDPVEREIGTSVTWALGMPTNERMDNLVEKATELGVTRLQPLVCERSVLRLQDERAQKKVAHWQAVAVAACEQCGRNRVPEIAPVLTLASWLGSLPEPGPRTSRHLLSLRAGIPPWRAPAPGASMVFLSGPEGGLAPSEEGWAQQQGFNPVSLGPRTLRADTAPVMVLAVLAAGSGA